MIRKEQLYEQILEQIDLTKETDDEELQELIRTVLDEAADEEYISLSDKIRIGRELFNSFRKLDVLQELLEDDSITEIMVNGIDHIFYEKEGRIFRFKKCFLSQERLLDVIQQIVGESNRYVNAASPIVDARLKDGSRVNVVLNPVAVNGYLPVGQFARPNSFGWGTLYTDNTNVSSSSNDVKFKTGYVSTGVSLGMAGGYVQFDMGNNRIQNNANNKYGIDFIVYGNAFKGNPEAAGVQVSNDGVNWYTLAGSRHYMSDTKWNQNISYIKIATANTTIGGKSFAKAGIYVSTDFAAPSSDNASDVDAAVALATWTGIPQLTGSTYPKTYTTDTPAAAAWWPEYASNENYGNVWNIGNAVNGVSWLRNGTAEVITYTGVTTVEDDMVVLNEGATAAPTQAEMTDVYQWGYADVRVNGSQYGTVVNNPYAAAPSTDAGAGGDGFDLSWAVKADGTPIALSSVRYVRVYSAVLFSAGVFGETSAEVCGLYVANAESSSVGTTAAPAITLADGPIPLDMATSMGNNVFYIPAETFEGAFTSGVVVTATASSSTAKVFINGESTGTFTIQDASRGVQILVQDGNSAPFILVIK